jgi:hypothetical protein
MDAIAGPALRAIDAQFLQAKYERVRNALGWPKTADDPVTLLALAP